MEAYYGDLGLDSRSRTLYILDGETGDYLTGTDEEEGRGLEYDSPNLTRALVEREEGSGTRAFLDRLVHDHRPPPLVELNSNSAICQAVVEGIGPTVLSRLAVQGHLRSGQLVEVPTRGRQLGRDLQAVWRDPLHDGGAAASFIEVARSAGPAGRHPR